jgi:tetratricopeptide (TPR) repeat protein
LSTASFGVYLSGDIDRALSMQRRAVAVDPLGTVRRQNLAVLLLASGRLDEALSEFRTVLEFRPDPEMEFEIARILVLQGRYEEAKLAVEKLPPGKYRDHGLALLYRLPGFLADADAALKRLVAEPGEIMDSVRLAEVYAFRGMNDEAFATLQEKKAELELDRDLGTAWVGRLQTEAGVSPFLKSLQADPRWTALIDEPG